MGLLSFGGKSSTSTSLQTDDRKVLDNGSQTFELSGNGKAATDGVLLDGNHNSYSSNAYSSTTNFSTVTDFGAVRDAMGIAAYSATNAAKVADSVTGNALAFGSDAFTFAGQGLSHSLDFASSTLDLAGQVQGKAVAGAFGFGSDLVAQSLDANRATAKDAFGFGLDSMAYVSDAYAGSSSGALSFGRSAMDSAFGTVSDAYAGSTSGALSFGRSAMDSAFGAVSDAYAGSTGKALGLVDSVVSDSMGYLFDSARKNQTDSLGLVNGALSQVKSATDMLGNAYADSQGRGALTDKMLMIAIAGAVLIAVVAVRAKR